jgi:6-pyruvoyltetrahydropterin/6-carboxytetrahydropterin synthase
MYELKVLTHFAAAHQLQMVAKKCETLHGHNWKVEVYISGDALNNAGVLMDFCILKDRVQEIMSELDHKFLNELASFKNQNPSSENIARLIARKLQERIQEPGIRVSRVTAWESDSAAATYIPD